MSQLSYAPLPAAFLAALGGIALVMFVLVVAGALRYVTHRMGLAPGAAFLVLVASLAGSYLNVPVADWPAREVVAQALVPVFGVEYVVPVVRGTPGTVLAVNVGGAVIPAVVSAYLVVRNSLWLQGVFATAFVALVTHRLAQPVQHLGIALPLLAPAVATAFAALLLAPGRAAALAYVAGSLGTLIGADLFNLGKIGGMGAAVASIGGAGTFDGIYVTGLLAVLIASLPDSLVPPVRGAGNGTRR